MLGRIIATLGMPPDWMLDTARHASKFFQRAGGSSGGGAGAGGSVGGSAFGGGGSGGSGAHALLSREEFEAKNGVPVSLFCAYHRTRAGGLLDGGRPSHANSLAEQCTSRPLSR